MKKIYGLLIIMTLIIDCKKSEDYIMPSLTRDPITKSPEKSFNIFKTYYLKKFERISKALLDSTIVGDSTIIADTIPVVPSIKLVDSIRYIKFASTYSQDEAQVNVHEIEAYSGGINIALHDSTIASSINHLGGGEKANVNDGDYISRWSSDRDTARLEKNKDKPQFIQIDLSKIVSVDSIRLYLFQMGEGADTVAWRPWKQTFILYVSKNLTDWDSVGGGINVNILNW